MPHNREKLKTYLVGGAVRDRLLGIEGGDRDWVVVGSTIEQMLELGFRQVGKDFPVFIDPETGEEYALARSERKTAPGYHGFEFDFQPDIPLELDLARRDLTMNAIAMDSEGNLVDPYEGVQDIENRKIRHVTAAFREDPVRVLRVAKFAARFGHLGFNVDGDTRQLMREMVAAGEVDALVPERIWQEVSGSLEQANTSRFLGELRECGALARILPEVNDLFGVPQVEKFHPEVDTGIHTLMSLDAAQAITSDPMVIFAVMVHDLGKALTPKQELPSHKGHEQRGLKPISGLCDRLGVPNRFRAFALKVCEYHLHCHMVHKLRPATVLEMLESLDGFRKPELVEKFMQSCLADKRGRTGHEQDSPGPIDLLGKYHKGALAVDGGQVAAELKSRAGNRSVTGQDIQREIRLRRLQEIKEIRLAECPENPD